MGEVYRSLEEVEADYLHKKDHTWVLREHRDDLTAELRRTSVARGIGGCEGEGTAGVGTPELRVRSRSSASCLPFRTRSRTMCCGGTWMKTLTASEARAGLYRLLDETAASHEPVQITGKRNNAVLVSEEDWKAVQETLYLLSIPGMRESIRQGMEAPLEEMSDEPGW